MIAANEQDVIKCLIIMELEKKAYQAFRKDVNGGNTSLNKQEKVMGMKWRTYFIIVGLAALLLAGYNSNVWANFGSSYDSTPEQATKEEDSGNESSDLSLKSEEFTVVDKSGDIKEMDFESERPDMSNGIVPTNVKVPSIGIDAPVNEVGVLENGQMGVPKNNAVAGWFEPGTKPGNTGNAVLAGHVDNRSGPAVFYYLKNLQKGDEIIVTNEEGKELTYVVQKLESYPADEAPIKEIFGKTDKKRLNLITCTGVFDDEKRTYLDRLVVYSELKTSLDEEKDVEEPQEDTDYDIKAPTSVKVNGTFVTWHAVRVDGVAGYRVYRSENGEDFEKVASISEHERKTYTDPKASKYTYYVTTVYLDGTESVPSKPGKSE
ncbi:class F sortase [Halobacillus shinanisalinarum]|uniref:Class F sortase n=1 Tax=Halobacillus shinanisalinarum TaxID=2932258 RepID=A0ABY4H0Y5_9BACI|nr:class F sortase [Halobacillus shinanisalinarum]UOQ94028.1 class F sortase [Halobacillus shinanisalinarum]